MLRISLEKNTQPLMNRERPSSPPDSTQLDLNNDQITTRILESGSPAELAQLKAHVERQQGAPLSSEEIERARAFAQQRRRFMEQSDRDMVQRLSENPEPSAAELQIGTYKENLEPPVRDAVLSLRARGYSSFESGFRGLEHQNISFDGAIPELPAHQIADDVRAAFAEAGAEPYFKERGVGFRMSKPISDETVSRLWKLLVRDLPPLAEPQPLTTVQTAVSFRERHKKET